MQPCVENDRPFCSHCVRANCMLGEGRPPSSLKDIFTKRACTGDHTLSSAGTKGPHSRWLQTWQLPSPGLEYHDRLIACFAAHIDATWAPAGLPFAIGLHVAWIIHMAAGANILHVARRNKLQLLNVQIIPNLTISVGLLCICKQLWTKDADRLRIIAAQLIVKYCQRFDKNLPSRVGYMCSFLEYA